MATYKIIGADQVEYGPVSAEEIRQWIAEGRVDAETKLQVDGGEEWKRAAEVPEFAGALGTDTPTPSACPTCGEAFEEGFDSCWQCGTGRDGSRPKEWAPIEEGATKAAEPCPKCGGTNVTVGRLLPSRHSISVTFRPAAARAFSLAQPRGVDLCTDSAFACRDCGLVWNYVRPEELKEFISKHCARSDNEDAQALLSEGARLESAGDIEGAMAKYAAVMEQFPETLAARQAMFSILNLKDKPG